MRRGLIEWSKSELPDSVFDTRIAAMRAAMAEAKIDALVAYTNFTRPSAVSWLCDFIPYWSECALVLPKDGKMTMISAVSPRGKPWIESTTYSENLLFTPKIAPETARVLKESLAAGSTLGVVELDEVPLAMGQALTGVGATLVDATAAFVSARAAGDAANNGLAKIAATIAHDALAAVGFRFHGRHRRRGGRRSRRTPRRSGRIVRCHRAGSTRRSPLAAARRSGQTRRCVRAARNRSV